MVAITIALSLAHWLQFGSSRYMEDEEAIESLAALAQPTRLATFKLLIGSLPEGIPAGEIARSVGTPQNTMSTHLGILARAGLIEVERHSRTMIYRAKPNAMAALVRYLNEITELRNRSDA